MRAMSFVLVVNIRIKEKTKVMLFEVYDDEKAFEAHQATPHFKKYLAEAVPLLASRERQVFTKAI
jgi:(4S)-4-hydroxy-5-phosphonooxypentane-2,3-dione isomerase